MWRAEIHICFQQRLAVMFGWFFVHLLELVQCPVSPVNLADPWNFCRAGSSSINGELNIEEGPGFSPTTANCCWWWWWRWSSLHYHTCVALNCAVAGVECYFHLPNQSFILQKSSLCEFHPHYCTLNNTASSWHRWSGPWKAVKGVSLSLSLSLSLSFPPLPRSVCLFSLCFSVCLGLVCWL